MAAAGKIQKIGSKHKQGNQLSPPRIHRKVSTLRLDTITRDFRHSFDPKERIRLAEDLAHELISRAELMRTFAVLKKTHDEKVEKVDSAIGHLTRVLCEGWEYRDVKCKVLWNKPKDRQKTIVRLDTGEQVAIESMTEDECQEELGLEVSA